MSKPMTPAQAAQQSNRTGGGQYKERAHAEADVDAAHLLEVTRDVGRYEYARRTIAFHSQAPDFAFDGEDLGSEAVLQILEAQAKTGNASTNPRSAAITIARRTLSKKTLRGENIDDMRARMDYQARLATAEQRAGRLLGPKERSALIEQVREETDKKLAANRRGALRQDYYANLNATTCAGDISELTGLPVASSVSSAEDEAFDNDIEAISSWLEQVRDSGHAQPQRYVERHAYNALAGLRHAPQARPGALSSKVASTSRAHMRSIGGGDVHEGVSQALAQWSVAEESEKTSKVLFAPFGDLDARGQEQVVQALMADSGQSAGRLWESAVTYATLGGEGEAPQTTL